MTVETMLILEVHGFDPMTIGVTVIMPSYKEDGNICVITLQLFFVISKQSNALLTKVQHRPAELKRFQVLEMWQDATGDRSARGFIKSQREPLQA